MHLVYSQMFLLPSTEYKFITNQSAHNSVNVALFQPIPSPRSFLAPSRPVLTTADNPASREPTDKSQASFSICVYTTSSVREQSYQRDSSRDLSKIIHPSHQQASMFHPMSRPVINRVRHMVSMPTRRDIRSIRPFSQPASPRVSPRGQSWADNTSKWMTNPIGRNRGVHRRSGRWQLSRSEPTQSLYRVIDEPIAFAVQSPAGGYSSTARNLASDTRGRLLISYHDLERALERRGLKNVRALIAAVGAVIVALGLAWPKIKQWGAMEGAEVAAASLEQEQLQAKAVAMVQEVLTDDRTARQVEKLLKGAVGNLFNDDEFTQWAVDWTSEVFAQALLRENVVETGTEYVSTVLKDEASLQTAEGFLGEAVKRLVADQVVQDQVASVSFVPEIYCVHALPM